MGSNVHIVSIIPTQMFGYDTYCCPIYTALLAGYQSPFLWPDKITWDGSLFHPWMGSHWLRPCSVEMTDHGPLVRYVKLRVAHAPGIPETFSLPSRISDPDMHHGTCVTHVPWYMPGSLTNVFLWSLWRGKRSRHSRCIRNPHLASIWQEVHGHQILYL